MKILFLVMILLGGCQEQFQLISSTPIVNSAAINAGRIVLTGDSLQSIQKVSPLSANLSGYIMEIESQTKSTLTLKLVHASTSAMHLTLGTVLSFLISNASASTTVNLTVDVAPSGAVMAFNLASCPAGWSAMDGNGGRPDVRGRTVIGAGTGPGLTARALGDTGGTENYVLLQDNLPPATVTILGSVTIGASTSAGDAYIPGPTTVFANTGSLDKEYVTSLPDTSMGGVSHNLSGTVDGLSDPVDQMQPYVALLYCQKD